MLLDDLPDDLLDDLSDGLSYGLSDDLFDGILDCVAHQVRKLAEQLGCFGCSTRAQYDALSTTLRPALQHLVTRWQYACAITGEAMPAADGWLDEGGGAPC